MFLTLYKKLRLTVKKLQLIVLKPLITTKQIIDSFDLTCCTSSYDFGTEGFSRMDALIIPHIHHLTGMKMEINETSKIFTLRKFSQKCITRILKASNIILLLLSTFISHHLFLKN